MEIIDKNNNVWEISYGTYLELIDLATTHGKKAGDSMAEEFEELFKTNNEQFKFLRKA